MTDSIRDIQIDLIMDNKNPIIDMFNGIWDNLSIVEVDVYHNKGGEFIYYNKDNKWIFFRDDKKKKFWCNYTRYWLIFQSNFNHNNIDIQGITKLLVENALNSSISKPLKNALTRFKEVEKALNISVTTLGTSIHIKNTIVQNALNNTL